MFENINCLCVWQLILKMYHFYVASFKNNFKVLPCFKIILKSILMIILIILFSNNAVYLRFIAIIFCVEKSHENVNIYFSPPETCKPPISLF